MDSGSTRAKNPNPRENANPLSIVTLAFTFPMFFKGFKKELEENDLYQTLTEHQSNRLGNKLEDIWTKEQKNAKQSNGVPSLTKALIKMIGFEYMLYGLALAFVEIVIKLAQPVFLGRLISYFTPKQESVSEQDAYFYAAGIIGCSLATVLFSHPYMMGVVHVGMKVRVACCSLLYRKALRLSKTALGQTTVGQVVNLLSNDVNRFDFVAVFIHQMWIGPIQTVVAMYLMYREVGISAVFGVISLLLFVPLQVFLGKLSSTYRMKTALRTDERVRLMNEIILGIQVIKMYTWEKPFAKLVALSRRFEIKAIRAASYIKGINSSFMVFTTRTALFVTVLSYVLLDNKITAEQVFMLTSYYNVLRQSMTVFFPQGLAFFAETNISIKRLKTFLLYDERQLTVQYEKAGEPSADKQNDEKVVIRTDNAITIQNGAAKWTESSTEHIFADLNLTIKRRSLVAVIGPVGSGKTSLFHAILKELPLIAGNSTINGKISYASQEPWLFSASVRQNILFGQEMNRMRYKSVVNRCALETDFNLFPYGDKTLVGERGVALSGGQRARINLARAVYKEADIYLLDDPLSAVDTHVGKQLFEKCIREYLGGKTVILITHQLQYLKSADHIIILDNGVITAEGSFDELQESGLDFAKLLKSHSEQADEEKENPSLSRQTSLQKKISIISTASTEGEDPLEVQEQRSSGSVSARVYGAYIGAAGNFCVIFILVILLVATQVLGSVGDYFMTFWVNLEQRRTEEEGASETFSQKYTFRLNETSAMRRNLQRTDDDFWAFSTETSIYVYSGLTAAIVVFALIRSFTFFSVCMKASVRLHDKMFESIIHATMRFFNTNTSGRILNRFSKDIGAIDERLPLAMVDVTQIGLSLVGVITVIGSVSWWLAIPALLIGIIFYFIRGFYMATSRSIKRLEGVTRSPVFSHLSASILGLTTIRAFGAEQVLQNEFDYHQDLHSSAFFIFISSSTAFGYWLDLICIIYVVIVTLSFLIIGEERYGGNVGLAITQSIGLTGMFQWGMRQTTELENMMTSVERVMEYTTVEHEPPLESSPDKKPTKSWPDKGEIKFVNLSLSYFPEDPPVLRNLNFTILPMEKVGIVGRTGAGKSSLIAALFRLTATEGSIVIDGVDTNDVGLHDLRSKISIIPQEPVLFSGTMRRNLDPFDEYDDETLWKALEEVELKEAVADMAAGLNSKMSEGGSNFSVGQRQLVCLARAIIRNNKILVLDEATANVDPQTDALIQQTIRKKFANCTVLTIAHRLHTVMDSDKILVMNAGTLVEFDHPHILLKNESGIFYSMVHQTGRTMAESLTEIAENSYSKSQRSTNKDEEDLS